MARIKHRQTVEQDSGILHALLNISNFMELTQHPKCGASWEGFAITQLLSLSSVKEGYFWSTYQSAELDFLLRKGQKNIGFECKFSDAPKLTKSMITALETLDLAHLYIVYPGEASYALHTKITAISLTEATELKW